MCEESIRPRPARVNVVGGARRGSTSSIHFQVYFADDARRNLLDAAQDWLLADSVAKVGRIDQWRNVRSDVDGTLNLSFCADVTDDSMLRAPAPRRVLQQYRHFSEALDRRTIVRLPEKFGRPRMRRDYRP